MVCLIPKASGGERPITIFRTVLRIIAKVVAIHSGIWTTANTDKELNMVKGRRVGDALYRAQIRAAIGGREDNTSAAEILIDSQKAFEYVSCETLVEQAEKQYYPKGALCLALIMYEMPRRLVVGKALSSVLQASRGIAAGSAFATTELWVIVASTVRRMVNNHPGLTMLVQSTTFRWLLREPTVCA